MRGCTLCGHNRELLWLDGRRPLEEAKRCAEYVLDKLRPTDAVALVKFDNRVQRLWPAVALGDGAPQRAATAGIQAGGNTNLHGGWKEGADALVDVSGQGRKRVILLSDGQANEGVTDLAEIAAQCAAWASKGITTSTYGLGNSFNEQLMVAMARAGSGNHYYGETADDLIEPFQQELELLGNLCLRALRLAGLGALTFSCSGVNGEEIALLFVADVSRPRVRAEEVDESLGVAAGNAGQNLFALDSLGEPALPPQTADHAGRLAAAL